MRVILNSKQDSLRMLTLFSELNQIVDRYDSKTVFEDDLIGTLETMKTELWLCIDNAIAIIQEVDANG